MEINGIPQDPYTDIFIYSRNPIGGSLAELEDADRETREHILTLMQNIEDIIYFSPNMSYGDMMIMLVTDILPIWIKIAKLNEDAYIIRKRIDDRDYGYPRGENRDRSCDGLSGYPRGYKEYENSGYVEESTGVCRDRDGTPERREKRRRYDRDGTPERWEKRKRDDSEDRSRTPEDTNSKNGNTLSSYSTRNRYYSSERRHCMVHMGDSGIRCSYLTNKRIGRLVVCSHCMMERKKHKCSTERCSRSPVYTNNGTLSSKCEFCSPRCISCNCSMSKKSDNICRDCIDSKICVLCHVREKEKSTISTGQGTTCIECKVNTPK